MEKEHQSELISIVISASSDIGTALCSDWLLAKEKVIGTFRDRTSFGHLESIGVDLISCDLTSSESIAECISSLIESLEGKTWDKLVLAAGTQNPIGLFGDNKFERWNESIHVNFISQVEILHALLPIASPDAKVMFFAGGGTNGSVPRYSAYTISKIASIKLCELLAAEYPEVSFFSLGPGWVRTKIHEETLAAGGEAGDNLQRTRNVLGGEETFPMKKLIATVNRLMSLPHSALSGRNFSAVHDPIEEESLIQLLNSNTDFYKLRRHGNSYGH